MAVLIGDRKSPGHLAFSAREVPCRAPDVYDVLSNVGCSSGFVKTGRAIWADAAPSGPQNVAS